MVSCLIAGGYRNHKWIAGILLCLITPHLYAFYPQSESDTPLDWSGAATFTLDYDENEREDDVDFSTHLRMKMGADLWGRRVSFVFNGRSRFDLDHGSSDRDRAFEKRTDQRVFQAFIETPDRWPGGTGIRLGRQWMHEIENVHLDGLRFSMKNEASDLMIFGGRPVSEFSSTSSDYVYGGQIRWFPFDSELRLYALVNDEDEYVNDQTGIGFSRSFLQRRVRANGDLKFLNGRGREIRGGVSSFIPSVNTDLSAHYYQRLYRSDPDEIAGDRVFSDFFRILTQRQRLQQLNLSFTKYLDSLAFGFGGNATIVNNDDAGNRDAIHVYLNLHVFDFIKKDLALLLQANFVRQTFSSRQSYDINGASGTIDTESRDHTYGASGQLDYQMNRDTRFSTGIAYSTWDFSSDADPLVGFDFTEAASSPIGVLTNTPELLSQDLGGEYITRTWFFECKKRFEEKWELRLRASYDRSTLSNNIGSHGYIQAVLRLTRRF